jgi:Glycosyl hydrolases family 38 N-terminal domain
MKKLFFLTAFALLGMVAGRDREDKLKVHIVPHSYNPDYLWNLDIYFPGMKDELTQVHFDKVFNSVIESLEKDSQRTFTHYEVKHFQSWYYR